MTRLEELIKELCPNGVEYKRLKDCSIMERGTAITQKQIQKGNIPVIAGGKKPAYYCDKFNREGETITVAGSGAYAGYLAYWDTPIFVSDAFSIKGKEGVSTKYLYYCLDRKRQEIYNTKKGGGVPHVHISSIECLQIQLPPLAVQHEIVRILDNFTLLSAELAAELTARCKQYEYYRDKLLHLDSDVTVQHYEFGDIAEIVRGASPRPISQFLTNDEEGINWIKIGDVEPKSKYIIKAKEKITREGAKYSRMVYPGDFVLSNSMSFGRPYILKIAGCIHDGWLSISGFQNYLLPDFLYYLLSSDKIQKEFASRASNSTVQNLNAEIVKHIRIPVPPLEVQKRLVYILDHFDAICNDLENGLPAEIEARQKQYEYYRDKLLSFRECV